MAANTQTPVDESLRPVLEQVRKDLLDFGMRNPLLNYRLLKSKGVESIPIDPVPLFAALVGEGQELRFTSAYLATTATGKQLLLQDGETPQRSDDLAWRNVPAVQQTFLRPDRFLDGQFIANHSEQDLDKRLLATYYAARTSIEEQGVNTLFLALGMLNWKDPSAPEDLHRAPLLLVPVELERQSASQGFRLRYSNDDVSPNVCLMEFLKQFNVKIELPSEDEEFDLRRFFQSFSDAIPIESEWSLDTQAIALGFFSFSKFLMYRDLDPAIWPSTSGLLNHDVLQRLLGSSSFAGETSALSDSDFLDDLLTEADQAHVLDADSTQTLALMDANSGKSMVIQGPPGTGKSQTIVNLIAGALVAGKTVLFVSEKKAALEVVKKRLDKCGLGSACLELHSNKAKKKDVIAELKRMADLEVRDAPPKVSDLIALQDSRAQLNEYCRAVNQKVGPSGERVLDLFGLILPAVAQLAARDIPQLGLPGALEWSEIEVEQKRLLVERLQSALSRVGIPECDPFWGSQLRVALPAFQERVRQTLLQAVAATKECRDAFSQLCALLGAEVAASLDEGTDLSKIAHRLLAAPTVLGLDLQNPSWQGRSKEIEKSLEAGNSLAHIRSNWSSRLRPEAWATDVSVIHDDLMRLRDKWWRFVVPEWRSAKRLCGSLVVGKPPKHPHEMLEVTCAIREAEMYRESIARCSDLLTELFGVNWAGEDSDWATLRNHFEWIKQSATIPEWGLRFITHCRDRALLEEATARADVSCRQFETTRGSILELLKCDDSARVATNTTSNQSFDLIETGCADLAERVNRLSALASYMQVSDECRSAGLGSVVDLANKWEYGGDCLSDVFQYWRASNLIDRAFDKSPILASFEETSHTTSADRFRNLDAESLHWARASIAKRHCASIPTASSGNGQLGYLRMMFERRSRYPAIRRLIENAGHAIQAFKPVFMMSPLSIANFVPPDSLRFDIVVFDEASQVRPADALGAIARGRQAIVVGDSKQLPPTSFFDALSNDEGDEDEPDGPATDIESVLGLFCARSAHQRMLRWHYRSRHESLIAGSNHLFYDDRLVVFPSPDKSRDHLGLIYHKVANAPYDRSRTRTNPVEARVVAQAVMDFAAEQLQGHPDLRLTLGVATFSVAQRDAMLDQLEILRRDRPNLEEFFTGPPHEPFFVKNLENVQGDERDAIFISVGYGRTKEGYLSKGFGPVNRNGGERRLNVLFSRARRRCEVFTTLSADDIDISDSSSNGGLRAFKSFLLYAERGQLDLATVSGRGPDSPFEVEVIRTLQRLGYTVETQVGCAGFFIDIAVLDEVVSGRYLIGIECDGASYHSARSARDRDRLRQAVLEDLGWKLHRIWSTAWFRDREREIDRLVAAIEAAKLGPNSSSRSVNQTESNDETDSPSPEADQVSEMSPYLTQESRKIPRYQTCHFQVDLQGLDLHLVPTATLVDWLFQVVKAEGPIHISEAARRIASGAGIQRVGGRIHNSIERACRAGSRNGKFDFSGDFLKSINQTQIPIRDRSELPAQMKKLSLVAPEEIDAAIQFVTGESYGISFDRVAAAACRVLGFARITEEMQTIAEGRRDSLLARRCIEQRGEMLFISQLPVEQ